jgi:predicted RNA methylase
MSSISPFVASPELVIRRLLNLANLQAGENFFDLGSGDGKTVIMAATEFGANAFGIEMREDLIQRANEKIQKLGINDKVKIIKNDIFNVDIRQADVVYLYLTTSANEKVRSKLDIELKSSARIVSHDYEIVGWKAEKIEKFCENPKMGFPTHTLYLYKKETALH